MILGEFITILANSKTKTNMQKTISLRNEGLSRWLILSLSVLTFTIFCLILTLNFQQTQQKNKVLGVNSSSGYQLRYNTNVNGGITFTGNTLSLSNPKVNHNGTGGAFVTTNSQLKFGKYPSGTTSDWTLSASEAFLDMEPGSLVLHAELIWGGVYRFKESLVDIQVPIQIQGPVGAMLVVPDDSTGGITYQNQETDFYMRSSNITEFVKANGVGKYMVSSVPGIMTEENLHSGHSGWTLAVVYQNQELPVRNLSLFLGPEVVEANQDGNLVEVTGFSTPIEGDFKARLLVSAQEGDTELRGDQMLFGKTRDDLKKVSGPNNPEDNFFASQINNNFGLLDTRGTFGNQNVEIAKQEGYKRHGWDITNVEVSSFMENSQTSAFTLGNSQGDGYQINALGLAIDVNAPFLEISLEVDKAVVTVGENLTYTIKISNTGSARATNLKLKNLVPENTKFVEGSLTVNGQAVNRSLEDFILELLEVGKELVIKYDVNTVVEPTTGVYVNQTPLEYEYQMGVGLPLNSTSTVSNSVNTEIIPSENQQLTAMDDKASTEVNNEVVIEVLENDVIASQDQEQVQPTVEIVSQPENGQAEILGDMEIIYTPEIDFVGFDEIVYEICINERECSSAMVTVEVLPDLSNTPEIQLNPVLSPGQSGSEISGEVFNDNQVNLYPIATTEDKPVQTPETLFENTSTTQTSNSSVENNPVQSFSTSVQNLVRSGGPMLWAVIVSLVSTLLGIIGLGFSFFSKGENSKG